jgi:DNA-binding SARP family transcriptional activator
MELLAYFITNRGRKLSPENITESLWGENIGTDPQNALRTQIFRLRKMLRESGLTDDTSGSGFEISFENGFYVFSPGARCRLDAAIFEDCIKEGNLLKDTEPDEAAAHYIKAIKLYKGEYLHNAADGDWVLIAKNKYQRLFSQAVLSLFNILKKQRCWQEIVDYFELAIAFEPLSESMHLFYLEALLELGEFKIALNHYNYLIPTLSRELDVKPSPALKSIYTKIISGESNAMEADIFSLRRDLLQDGGFLGAMYCELEYFRMIYQLEERRSLREDNDVVVGLITLISTSSGAQFEPAMEKLKTLLCRLLRKGDVFTEWNRRQMILLLLKTKLCNTEQICRRIRNEFAKLKENFGLDLHFSFEPVFDINESAG